jgi:hypothetical protein
MMNRMFPFIALLLLLISQVACTIAIPSGKVQGSGEVIRESRPVEAFDQVNLEGFGEVDIRIGGTQSLVVETDDNLLEYIETRIENDVLILGIKEDAPRSLEPSDTIRFEVVTQNLEAVRLSGAGDIQVGDVQEKDFEVNVSGGGNVSLSALDAERLDLLISGAGKINLSTATTQVTNIENSGAGSVNVGNLSGDLLAVLISGAGNCQVDSGQVTRQKVEISGMGSFDAPDLKSNQADLQISGAGGATIWVVEMLDVAISGAGGVQYYGSPELTVDNSGVGKVEGLGAK